MKPLCMKKRVRYVSQVLSRLFSSSFTFHKYSVLPTLIIAIILSLANFLVMIVCKNSVKSTHLLKTSTVNQFDEKSYEVGILLVL